MERGVPSVLPTCLRPRLKEIGISKAAQCHLFKIWVFFQAGESFQLSAFEEL